MIALRTAVALVLLVAACKREERSFRTDPPIAQALDQVAVMPGGIAGASPDVDRAQGHAFVGNAYQLSQGKQLFDWFNCSGCHANGGGASGPALMNAWWRYGPDEVSIFVSIRDGRPHGMPAFRDKLTTEQVWQLTQYVRTIGTTSATTAAPNRNDSMHTRPAENRGPATFDASKPAAGQ
ncbi:MAG TPA: c-type cytochrome [Rhodopila sp.]|jgi:cytochrome c oxidase cbb3-type subunit 3